MSPGLRIGGLGLLGAILLSLASLLHAEPSSASAAIGFGRLQIQGSSLSIYSDELTTDADQTINVNERARVRTCFGGVDTPCGNVLPGDPNVAGMLVKADLRGPEIPQSIPLETVPGGTFVLPGFQQEGDYRLENVRLVDAATDRVLGLSEPSVAILHVRKILLASATVRTLSLEELKAKGITLSEENFQAFNFAVGFAFGDEIVEIELPLIYAGYGKVDPLAKPTVNVDGLPPDVRRVVERWQPPSITPFTLDRPEREGLDIQAEEDQGLSIPLFGAIVLPGNVSYLNQFFEAKLVVANGAPAGSDATLQDLRGNLRLPSGEVLRIAATEPSVAPGQAVPVYKATGSRTLFPGEQGSAAWTVEGLETGTHTVRIDVEGDLHRPGRDPYPVLSRIQAAVEVVDARFNLTFSHPDVVREGEEYSLFVTVTNLSRVSQNLITVDLTEDRITGAAAADPDDPLRHTIETLGPGQGETLEYRLVAQLTGRVVATTFQSESPVAKGTIRLFTGVGELGIPLSPATLVLPRFSDRLKSPFLPDDELHLAHNRFLGLAYSLAVAPSALTPQGLPRVIRTDVERRAIDFAHAGLRTFIGEEALESLEVLALEYLGNRNPILEIDELRRRIGKGRAVGMELGRVLRWQQVERGLDAEALFEHFQGYTSYADPYVAALLVPDAGSESLSLEIASSFDGIPGVLSGIGGSPEEQRTLAFGEVFGVQRAVGNDSLVPFALVGRVALDQELRITVSNPGSTTAAGDLLLTIPEADGMEDRAVRISGLSVPAGSSASLRVGAALGAPQVVDATGSPVAGTVSETRIVRPPFRLVGSRQDFRLKESGPDIFGNYKRPNRYGNGLFYLFNRPPEQVSAQTETHYRIRSSFDGLDEAGDPASSVSERVGTGAWVQDDPRIVTVRYSTPLSALIDPATVGPLLDHEHDLSVTQIRDLWGESLSSDLPPPRIDMERFHFGGLVTGRVVRGTGEPVEGARVKLIRKFLIETMVGTKTELHDLGDVVTGPDGVFLFDFVEEPHWDPKVVSGFTLRAEIPPGADPLLEPAETQEVSSKIRLQNRMARVNIALLGRGTIEGQLMYADTGEPVPGGRITAASTLFNEEKFVEAGADGSFRVPGMPVGPITLTGRDADKRTVYATVGIERPGDTVRVTLKVPRSIPGLGTVFGAVTTLSGEPVPGARVAVYSRGALLEQKTSDEYGKFRFDDVPEGQVSLQAAKWEVSRTPVVSDVVLAAGEEKEVTLRLVDGETRTVTGSVFFHDPIVNRKLPVVGAVAFIEGPGVFAYTDASGNYTIEGVPVQGEHESYSVKAIDFERKLEGVASLPPVLDCPPEPEECPVIAAPHIVLESMEGGIDGVVLDPLGRPMGGVGVVAYPFAETTSAPDGSFSFHDLPIGSHPVIAHVGDGLQDGRVGYFGEVDARIVYGGHRPFVSVRMRGSGVVSVTTRTATATGIKTPIYFKHDYFSEKAFVIKPLPAYSETTTVDTGSLEKPLTLPVGPYEIVAYNPFHGLETISGKIEYAGQVIHHEIVFKDASRVAGVVVNVDGVTPVADVEVTLEAQGLKPQTQRTDPQGQFAFELVPPGGVQVTARGLAGTVERVGRTMGSIRAPGQTLDMVVQLKAQGTVEGQVLENFNGDVRPIPNALFYVQENAFPFRRLPLVGQYFVADSEGRYSVPHVYAGSVTVVAKDPNQVSRNGSSRGVIDHDWQVLFMEDIEMKTSVGSLEVFVRDPVSGGPVADAQIKLSDGTATVTRPDGSAFFDALELGTYSLYAFYAPTGSSGRLSGVQLTSPGQHVVRTLYLDQRGEVRGTLWEDVIGGTPVPGAVVRLNGQTAGGRVTALATSSSDTEDEGRFYFLGIPEGDFSLSAAIYEDARRAHGKAPLTDTAPIVDVNMVFEPVGDIYFRLQEKLTAGLSPVDLTAGLFSTRLTQGGIGKFAAYDFTAVDPVSGTDVVMFPEVLLHRSGSVSVLELSGERRKTGASFQRFDTNPWPVAGSGTQGDPFQLTLGPKGVVKLLVLDGAGQPLPGASVNLSAPGERFPSVTGPDGTVTFYAVPAGSLTATASSLSTGTGGRTSATLTYDDQVVEMTVQLASAVRAHGIVYLPVPGDIWDGNPASLVPAPGVIVEIRDSKGQTQVVLTDDDGRYSFEALPTGWYRVRAQDNNGDQFASHTGELVGEQGENNEVPALILDAGPPRIVSIAPPPGMEGVSTKAVVELVFSEPLLPGVLPSNAGNPHNYFRLRSASGAWPTGAWTSALDGQGRQIVRFTPSGSYESFTVYSLTILGGSGGVRDRMGRPLTTSGNVGSNFTTADTVGPRVIGTEPSLDRPVDPSIPVRIDFNEKIVATDTQLANAVRLEWQRDTGSGTEWRSLPVTTYLTRNGYSLAFETLQAIDLSGDTLRRRLTISGLRDAHDNEMPEYVKTFRIWDGNAPIVDAVPLPTADGRLLMGHRYTLVPQLSNLDDLSLSSPGGDVDRVEYYFEDPTDPDHPVSPSFSARKHPFSYTFVAAYSGTGEERRFPVWVRAVDTSTNESNVVPVDMVVLPNTEPSLEYLNAAAIAPVPGVFYAGSTVLATASGFDDLDELNALTLSFELRVEGESEPLVRSTTRSVPRPNGGWRDASSQTYEARLPLDIPEGTVLFFRAMVKDNQGKTATLDSAPFTIEDDTNPPVVDDLSARLGGAPVTTLFIGETFLLEIEARDVETAVQTVTLELDRTDLFPDALLATRVSGTDLFRTSELVVPLGIKEPQPVVVTVRVDDYGDNSTEATTTFHVAPERDPNAPSARWIFPWQGALWPEGYASTVSDDGAAVMLRFYARDTRADADGNSVPGRLVIVEVRGPEWVGGKLVLADAYVPARIVPGTEDLAGAEFEAMWRIPNGIPAGTDVPFEVRLVDGADTERLIRTSMTAVPARRTYEAVRFAVIASDPMLEEGGSEAGPVFLLDGSVLSIYPGSDGDRVLGGLFVYTGASEDTGSPVSQATVLTAPEISNHASADLYHPLELHVTDEIGVSVGSRIDVSRRGLLGNRTPIEPWELESVHLPGETAAQRYAGGSHAGQGGYGSPSGGWDRDTFNQPGSVYDSLKDPYLPGSGGGSSNTGGSLGGNGGGVVRLLAPSARVRLDGDVLANGGNGVGGGAGGTIRILAGRIEGRGSLSARGGHGSHYNSTGGGGGGRVALSFMETGGGFDPLEQTEASGGHNHASDASQAVRRAGAGTIVVERRDPVTGESLDVRLEVRNPKDPAIRPTLTRLPALGNAVVVAVDVTTNAIRLSAPGAIGEVVGDELVSTASDGAPLGRFPILEQSKIQDDDAPAGFWVDLMVDAEPGALDALAEAVDCVPDPDAGVTCQEARAHGEARLGFVEAEGAVRLVADDDLVLGPAEAPALNDREHLLTWRGARALFRDEGPVASFTTTPIDGEPAHLGSDVSVDWTVADPLGLVQITEEGTYRALAELSYRDERTEVTTSTSRTMTVPLADPPPALEYTVQARNLAGRESSTTVTWPVPENAAPTGTVGLGPEVTTPVPAGYEFEVIVTAEDPEGLATIVLNATGAVTSTQSTAVSGSMAQAIFTIEVPSTADGSEAILLQAVIEDVVGATVPTNILEVAVAPNAVPGASLRLADGTTTPVQAGYPFSVIVSADDSDGLTSVTLTATGPVEVATQTSAVSGTTADVTFEVSVLPTADGSIPVTLTAEIEDVFGSTTTTSALEVPVTANDAPTVTADLGPEAPARIEPGGSTTIVVHAVDGDGLERIDLEAPGPVAAPSQSQTVSGTEVDATFTLTATADATPGPVTVTATVTDRLGSTMESAPLTFDIVRDVDPPVVTLTLDPDRGTDFYRPGETVTISSSATDEIELVSLTVTAGDQTESSGGDALSFDWIVPDVASSTTLPIEAVAVDGESNEGTATHEITIEPYESSAVAIACPSNGAILPSDHVQTVTAVAASERGIVRVELFADDTSFALLEPTDQPLETTISGAVNLADFAGPTVAIRADVTDVSGAVVSHEIELNLVDGVDLFADGQGTNDWTLLENEIAVLRSGTLTLDQPMKLGGLIVLGGKLVHPVTQAGAERSLELDVGGSVYIGCGGAIDVTGLGYGRNGRYPGHSGPGQNDGGSHLGAGGGSFPGQTYGSVYFPQENGGGGEEPSEGGGVVRIAARRVQVDGVIQANGSGGFSGGAGGSVWITTESLGGVGVIEAKGGNATGDGSGGGGAISVEYSTLEAGSELVDNLRAYGGSTKNTGGAGTVYLREGENFGELVVDNGTVSGNRRTILPSLGSGVADPGSNGDSLVIEGRLIPAYFVGHWVEIYDAVTKSLEGTWRVAKIEVDDGATPSDAADDRSILTLASIAGEPVTVGSGDTWQGVYRFDDYTARGDVQVISADPIRVYSEQVITGNVETNQIRAGRLVIESGAKLTHHPTWSSSEAQSLFIEVDELVVKAGGTIDVTARGYGQNGRYPGHSGPGSNDGGSHLGAGGGSSPGETYGSVYLPQENGAGGEEPSQGGGVVRIAARRVQVDGVIQANGSGGFSGGAGGSVWITTESLGGVGVIEAKGGNATGDGSGGGGAISIEYSTLEAGSELVDNLRAYGGSTKNSGGAGTVYLREGESFGELVVDNGTVSGNRRTILPSLGSGSAGSGSLGAVLETGLAWIPEYFVGHWVEIYDGTTGVLEGTWRVTEIWGDESGTVTLASNSGEPVTVNEDDSWQGVYRFDDYTARGDVQVISKDPIRVYSEQVITGNVETSQIRAGRLVIESGAKLTHHPTWSSSEAQSLFIEVDELVVKAGGTIDVTARGYGQNGRYPGHSGPGSNDGGSHLGAGGGSSPGETYGSVYFPQENGGGGEEPSQGGGVVRIAARRVQVDGVIQANGSGGFSGGAGGSVWITTESLGGVGVIEAKGGNATGDGSGGGGAISIEYSTLEAGSELVDNLRAYGGSTKNTGGAGTVYLREGESFGELVVDNGTVGGNRRTILPSLGSGVADAGSKGDSLVIEGRLIPAYFVGHWVEINDAVTGALEGAWRVETIEVDDGGTPGDATDDLSILTLASIGGEPVTVSSGDTWRGVYRFDGFAIRGLIDLRSEDPIRILGEQVITGDISMSSISATKLTIEDGGSLTHRPTSTSGSAQSLFIEVDELVVRSGGAIDVTGLGYGRNGRYPGHSGPGSNDGGSHLGAGGGASPGETYGSVYFPQENGAGGEEPSQGGGVVRIAARRVQVDGVIQANGSGGFSGGAGGSVWVTTESLGGVGVIEAKGGNATGDGSGGGGAISIEYSTLEAGTELLDSLRAYGGSTQSTGGAGTIYLRPPTANLGSLIVDNGSVAGTKKTILPPLGRGIVQNGSSGGTILTGRDTEIPEYFLGSWVEVEGPDRYVKGIWRIARIEGTTIHLEPKAAYDFTIAPGDRWRGIYRFDDVTISSNSILESVDPIVQIVPDDEPSVLAAAVLPSFGSFYGNDAEPVWDETAITVSVGTVPGSYKIDLGSTAVTDADGIAEVRLTSGGRHVASAWSSDGVSFLWAGEPAQLLHLVAIDAHGRFRRAGWLELPPLPDGGWSAMLELDAGATPLAVTGGIDWTAIGDRGVWVYQGSTAPWAEIEPASGAGEVLSLAADSTYLYAGYSGRIDVLDRGSSSLLDVSVETGSLVDLVSTASGEAVALLRDGGFESEPILRLAWLRPAAGSPLTLDVVEEAVLPDLAEPSLHANDGYLHLVGLEADGTGTLYSWSTATADGLTLTPQVSGLAGGWNGLGRWSGGVLALDDAAVRLLAFDGSLWSEIGRVDLVAPPLSAAVVVSRLVVMTSGEVLVYDVTDPAAPSQLAVHPGSSHTAVEPMDHGKVLLWAPRMASPPLRWDPAAAIPGAGFEVVWDGLP